MSLSPDEASELDRRLEAIHRHLEDIERRLTALETARGYEAPEGDELPRLAAPSVDGVRAQRLSLPLLGRLLLILAGAFLLRAITEAVIVPQTIGTALGVSYAVLWMVMAFRPAGRQRPVEANVYAWASVLIGYPLLWEVTAKFHLLPPRVNVAVLAALTAIGLFVGWRRHLRNASSVVTLAAALTCLALGFSTRDFLPFTVFLLALGLVTVWLAYDHGWVTLAAVTAILVNLTVLSMTSTLVLRPGEGGSRPVAFGAMLVVQFGLILVYFGSFAARTLGTGRDISLLEILQAVVSLMLGLGGALLVEKVSNSFGIIVGGFNAVLAAACYAMAFASIDKRLGRRLTFIFYSSAALVFTIVGFSGLLHGAWHAIALALAALFTASLGAIRSRATLSLHGAVLIVAAATSSGLFTSAVDSFWGEGVPTISWITFPVVLTITVAATCCILSVQSRRHTWGRFSHAPKLVALTLLLLGLGGVLVTVASRLLVGVQPEDNEALLAVVRTAVLALAAVALALVGRLPQLEEATMLVYPVLLLGGAKLLFEDLRTGRPATLVFSLLLFGSALILSPRLRRRVVR